MREGLVTCERQPEPPAGDHEGRNGLPLRHEATTLAFAEHAARLLNLIFDDHDLILFRPIETWNEGEKKRSRVCHRRISYRKRVTLHEQWFFVQSKIAEAERANLFFGVCPRFGGDGRFDQAWQIRTVRCLWADLDDCSVEEALQRIKDAGLPEPSFVVASGNGVHVYWALAEPFLIDDVGDPIPVEKEWVDREGKRKPVAYIVDPATNDKRYFQDPETSRRIAANVPELSTKAIQVQDVLGGIAAKIGGDYTTDLSRLLRVPGTLNRKDERNGREPRPCSLATGSGGRYPFSLFEPLAAESPGAKERNVVESFPLPAVRPLRSGKKIDRLNHLVWECGNAPVGDRSDADFALCCYAIEQGVDKDEVRRRVASIGKFKERGGDYFDQTWKKAEGRTRRRLYEKQAKKILAESDGALQPSSRSKLPEVTLPGDSVPVCYSAQRLGRLIADTRQYFRRGDAVVKLGQDDTGSRILRAMKPAAMASGFESVAILRKMVLIEGELVSKPSICNEQTAKLIVSADTFLDELPPIRILSPCPVLIERGGELVQIVGYDRDSGVLAFGEQLPEVPLDEAKDLIETLIRDFRFASASDRSRAMAAIITPALVHGRLLRGRAPIDLGEADQSQTGKGFRNKITAALYRQTIRTVTQRKGGVGSMEETFNAALIRGANFIAFDNMRGKIDSPAFESFMTEDIYAARIPYSPDVEIDPRRVVVMLTSNRAEITRDLANRSSCVRILKQEPGYQFASHPEGDILEHLGANQPRYLGAVFAIIREWHRQGKPRTHETRHDFRRWAQTLDWIVQNILGAAPLLDGHEATRERMTNPALTWLRDVALAVVRANRDGQPLRAHDMLDLLADTEIEIPGASNEADLEDENVRSNVLRAIGRKLSKCFKGESSIEIDGILIERSEAHDDQGRPRWDYWFGRPVRPDAPPHVPNSPQRTPRIETLGSRIPRRESEQSDNGADVRKNPHNGAESEKCDPRGVCGGDGGEDGWESIKSTLDDFANGH